MSKDDKIVQLQEVLIKSQKDLIMTLLREDPRHFARVTSTTATATTAKLGQKMTKYKNWFPNYQPNK